MLTIILLNQDGAEPLEHQVVLLTFFRGVQGWSAPRKTNERGEAYFLAPPGEGAIYINGSPVYQGYLGESSVVYLLPERAINAVEPAETEELDQRWKRARPQVQYEDDTAGAVERALVVPPPPQLQNNYPKVLVAGE